jgi:hypothetical protein
MSSFKKADRKRVPLKLALVGPSGSGKTYSAIRLARGLVGPDGKIAVIDTERSSAEMYSELTDYDVAPLDPPYSPDRYISLLREAAKEYDVVIIDSLSHAWGGAGGILDIHDKNTQQDRFKNSFSAWRTTNKVNDALIETVLGIRRHIIATMRTKTAYDFEVRADGKKVPVKIGLEPVQRANLDYEFSVVGVLDHSHMCLPSKDRTGVISKWEDGVAQPILVTEETGRRFAEWLESGGDPGAETVAERAWREGAEACDTVEKLRVYVVGNQPADVGREFREGVWRKLTAQIGGGQ